MSASELDRPTEVLDCSVGAAGSEQRLRSMLPHDCLPGCARALRNESVVLPYRAEVITEVTFAVCDQSPHAQALWESFEALEGALRVTGPQQFDDCSQRVTRHVAAELREVGDRWPKVSTPNDPARSALDVTRHCNTVERIARDPSSARQHDLGPSGSRSAFGHVLGALACVSTSLVLRVRDR